MAITDGGSRAWGTGMNATEAFARPKRHSCFMLARGRDDAVLPSSGFLESNRTEPAAISCAVVNRRTKPKPSSTPTHAQTRTSSPRRRREWTTAAPFPPRRSPLAGAASHRAVHLLGCCHFRCGEVSLFFGPRSHAPGPRVPCRFRLPFAVALCQEVDDRPTTTAAAGETLRRPNEPRTSVAHDNDVASAETLGAARPNLDLTQSPAADWDTDAFTPSLPVIPGA